MSGATTPVPVTMRHRLEPEDEARADFYALRSRLFADAAGDEYTALFLGVGKSEINLHGSHWLTGFMMEKPRILVAGNPERKPVPIAVQRAFFERHIAPWVFLCCAAIRANAVANYYIRVAQFAQSYLALESDSFAID